MQYPLLLVVGEACGGDFLYVDLFLGIFLPLVCQLLLVPRIDQYCTTADKLKAAHERVSIRDPDPSESSGGSGTGSGGDRGGKGKARPLSFIRRVF